jgi:hypothetical protein
MQISEAVQCQRPGESLPDSTHEQRREWSHPFAIKEAAVFVGTMEYGDLG